MFLNSVVLAKLNTPLVGSKITNANTGIAIPTPTKSKKIVKKTMDIGFLIFTLCVGNYIIFFRACFISERKFFSTKIFSLAFLDLRFFCLINLWIFLAISDFLPSF